MPHFQCVLGSCITMSHAVSLKKFVAALLLCYLGYILTGAYTKLQERKIGTAFQSISEKTVKERTVSISSIFCAFFKTSFKTVNGIKIQNEMVSFYVFSTRQLQYATIGLRTA